MSLNHLEIVRYPLSQLDTPCWSVMNLMKPEILTALYSLRDYLKKR